MLLVLALTAGAAETACGDARRGETDLFGDTQNYGG